MPVSQSQEKGSIFIIGLLILYCLSVVIHLGYQELGAEEPRRAIISLEMMHSGNYIKATQMGETYINKPVLYNWIQCGFMKLTGSTSELVLRLPSLLFYLVLAFFHYRISRLYFPKAIAILSAFFTLTCLDIFFYGLSKGAEIDIFYSTVVYLQGISMFYYYQKGKWTAIFVASYLFCAIGFLTKGFPSIMFQGLTLAALCVYAKSIRVVLKWQHLAGILTFFVITGSYFYAFSFYGAPLDLLVNLLQESIIKSAVGERSDRVFEKIIGYPALFLKLIAPWCLLLLLLFKKSYRNISVNPLVRFSVLFIVFNIWVYAITGQPKARYVYMFLPFTCTVLVALYQKLESANAPLLQKILGYLGWAFVLVAAGIVVLPFFITVSWLATVIMLLLFILLLYFYRNSKQRIWLFVTGIILARLVYAVLVIPIQHDKSFSHQRVANEMAKATNGQEMRFWSPRHKEEAIFSNKLFSWKPASMYTHTYLFAQIPYYYYSGTGHLVTYDSILRPGQSYISFVSETRDQPIEPLYRYYDPLQRDSFVVYRYMGNGGNHP